MNQFNPVQPLFSSGREPRYSAVRICIVLAASVFAAEAAVMIALAVLPPLGPWTDALLDPTTMVLLISPLLYRYAFRPLVDMLKEREIATEALRQANEQLEARVKDRTLSLERANQRLEIEIIERKKGEAELRRAKEEWERTFDAVPDLIAIIDEQHHILRANRAMAARLTLQPGECVGKLCFQQVHGTTCPPADCPHRLTLADGCEHANTFHDCLGGDFLITTTPLTDEAGRRVASVHVARDITLQKRNEEALRRARDELELRVQERTADLLNANEQLRQESDTRRQKEMELARVSRITMASQLSASLAHELNQPLGAIVCNVQAAEKYMLRLAPPLDEVRNILTEIEADGKRAGEIIHHLRALYQKTEHKQDALQFNEVVQETTDLMRRDFVLKGVSLELELSPDLPLVRGNQIELQQVIINLIVNALEAMAAQPPDSRRLHLATFSLDAKAVGATIRDFGPGIPSGQLRRLFEPFFTTKAAGMGMGLAICRSIIEAHEGRLWGENNPSGGAMFHLALPACSRTSP